MKSFFQVSWIGRNGERVWSDIETDRAKAIMQMPVTARGVEIHQTHAENRTDLKRQRSMHEPTPRKDR